MNSRSFAAALAAMLVVPAGAHAQASAPTKPAAPAAAPAAALAEGVQVLDSQGVPVATVERISGDQVVINTGSDRATLPRTAFAGAAQGVSVNVTKAQLEAAIAEASARAGATLDAALVANAPVKSQDGSMVGTIKDVKGDEVILDRPAGAVSLSRQFFTTGSDGVVLRMTAAQLEAAARAASQPAS